MNNMKNRLPLFFAAILCLAPLWSCRSHSPRTIAFMTDFDLRDESVGVCKAVMAAIAPRARIIDITHQVQPYSVTQAARLLADAAPYFPKDAVFVVVVDPGVGSARKPIIARSKTGQYFVLPDNGLLTLVQDRDGIAAAREIANPGWTLAASHSITFHGRDVFSPAAAHLARGDDWTKAGPELDVSKLTRLGLRPASVDEQGLHGQVIGMDGPYGNIVLNVPEQSFARLGYALGDMVPVMLDSRRLKLPFVRTFSDVPPGMPLLYIDSRKRLSLGVNLGNFEQAYRVSPVATLSIPWKAGRPR